MQDTLGALKGYNGTYKRYLEPCARPATLLNGAPWRPERQGLARVLVKGGAATSVMWASGAEWWVTVGRLSAWPVLIRRINPLLYHLQAPFPSPHQERPSSRLFLPPTAHLPLHLAIEVKSLQLQHHRLFSIHKSTRIPQVAGYTLTCYQPKDNLYLSHYCALTRETAFSHCAHHLHPQPARTRRHFGGRPSPTTCSDIPPKSHFSSCCDNAPTEASIVLRSATCCSPQPSLATCRSRRAHRLPVSSRPFTSPLLPPALPSSPPRTQSETSSPPAAPSRPCSHPPHPLLTSPSRHQRRRTPSYLHLQWRMRRRP